MSDPSKKFDQATLLDIGTSTGSPESADGLRPSGSPVGPPRSRSGPDPALANLSPKQGIAPGQMTLGTYGLSGSGSSETAALNMSLGSRLEALLDSVGSITYTQTWRLKHTPSGLPYWEHTARERLIDGSEFGFWPTPALPSGGRSIANAEIRGGSAYYGDRKTQIGLQAMIELAGFPTPKGSSGGPDYRQENGDNLPTVAAVIANWPTPDASGSNVNDPEWQERRRRWQEEYGGGHNGFGLTLGMAAELVAGWPTPMAGTPAQNGNNEAGNNDSSRRTVQIVAGWGTPRASDADKNIRTLEGALAEMRRKGMNNELPVGAMVVGGWATPIERDHKGEQAPEEFYQDQMDHPRGKPLGRQVLLFCAPTERSGSLNPEFVRWLMGYPDEWGSSGDTETP